MTGPIQAERSLEVCRRPGTADSSANAPTAARTSGAIGLLEEFRADPPVRGAAVLGAIESAFRTLNHVIERVLPSSMNPLAQSGAMANVAFLVALASGIPLLFWYSPSVHQAYGSLETMRGSFLGQFMRSLHRYSSDLCMLFVLLHLVQVTAARLFTGARWLAWVTGIVLTLLLVLVGWTGYWLVWDTRAQQLALATARLLDVVPIFAEPFSRSFLADDRVTTLQFFIVFFTHMLIPLAMGIGLWLHISRLSRSKFLTNRALAWATVAGLAVVSLLVPAFSASPARMSDLPSSIPMDVYYMAPLWVMERMTAGSQWILGFVGLALVLSIPWILAKTRVAPVVVVEERCNGCTQCYHDCPYSAITMRLGGMGKGEAAITPVAVIDPSLCVGCGICVGSCNPAAIDYTHLPVREVREKMADWYEKSSSADRALAFLCTHSAAADLRVDTTNGLSVDLPGYRIVPVPCTGWVHPLMIERALKQGYTGVLVIGCQTMPLHREGAAWTADRLEGARLPHLRDDQIDGTRVMYRRYDSAQKAQLLEEADAFRRGGVASGVATRRRPRRLAQALVATVLVGILGVLTVGASDVLYASPASEYPQLVVSFRLPGQRIDLAPPPADDPSVPIHMRGAARAAGTGSRRRSDVRLRVSIDGVMVLEKSVGPHGLFGDGESVAMERMDAAVGTHQVKVELGETADPNEWTYRDERSIEFEARVQRVVLFDKSEGFAWR